MWKDKEGRQRGKGERKEGWSVDAMEGRERVEEGTGKHR